MLSRKDYKALAKMVDGNTCVQLLQEHPAHYILKDTFVSNLADYLETDNSNFDRDGFYEACLYNKTFAIV